MLAIWQTLFVCLTGSLTTDARSNLFPGAPAGYHGCKEPVPMRPSALNRCPPLKTRQDMYAARLLL